MHDPLRAKTKVVLYSATAFLAGLGIASGLGWTQVTLAMPVINESPQIDPALVAPAVDLSDAFVNLSEAVTPGVVRIEARVPYPEQREMPQGFERFFGPPQQRNPDDVQVGGGSGFVVSEDGYILTNNHVIDDATSVTVILADKTRHDAEVVGGDPFTDVAVLKIDAGRDLETLSFGDSDEVRVGEWILAIGNPGFGAGTSLDFTVTAGIVSARGRPLRILQNNLQRELQDQELAGFAIEDFIQTDAVINPGNSGGPMVDATGRVIGINSAIASRTGYYQGYGFAIPINLARRIMEDLVEYGSVRRPILGVRIEDVTPEDAEYYRLPSVSGVQIVLVNDGGPAEDAGLRAEDVIVSIDGREASYVGGLQAMVTMRRPGDRITVGFYRDGNYREAELRLGEADLQDAPRPDVVAESGSVDRLGIQVRANVGEVADDYGFRAEGGVVITDVAAGSAALRGRLLPGRLILEIDRTEIETVADVEAALSEVAPGQVVRFLLEDSGGNQYVETVRMPR